MKTLDRSPDARWVRRTGWLLGLAALMIHGSGTGSAGEVKFYRVAADAPTRITGFLPDGTLTWTSAQENVQFTVETLPPQASAWGSVVSGTQPDLTGTASLYQPPGVSAHVISVRTLFSETAVPAIRVNLQNLSPWSLLAQGFTDSEGWLYFYDTPPGDYLVGYDDGPLYSGTWWDSPIVDGVQLQGEFTIQLTKWAPDLRPASNTILGRTAYSWGTLPECASYRFSLFHINDVNHYPTLIDEAPHMLGTNYQPAVDVQFGAHYRWEIDGFDIWNNPVMHNATDMWSEYTGTLGGSGDEGGGGRLFGVTKFSTVPVAGLSLQVKDLNQGSQVVKQTTTDGRGWFVMEDIPPGFYALSYSHPDYVSGDVYLSLPEDAGHQGVSYLTKSPPFVSPEQHATVTDRTPTFSWSGIPESVVYDLSVRDFSTWNEMFHRTGTTATIIESPVSLSDGDYYWQVLGYNTAGTMVLTHGSRFTVNGP